MEMDFAHRISAIYHDKPGVMYENPPPPSDDFEYDFESIFFTYPRPQSVKGVECIKVDRRLFSKLLGLEEEEEKENSAETIRGNVNVEGITERSNADVSVNRIKALEKGMGKSKASKEISVKDAVSDKRNIKCEISQEEESAIYLVKKKEKKHKKESHSKKSSRHRKRDKDTSSTEISVKPEISSDEEGEIKTLSKNFSRKAEISIKEEVLSDKDDYRKEKRKKSKSSKKKNKDARSRDDSRKYYESRSRDDSRSRDHSRSRDDSRSRDHSRSRDDSRCRDHSRSRDNSRSRESWKNHDSRSHDSWNNGDSKNRLDGSPSPDDVNIYSRKNHSDYSSDDSRNRYYEDSNSGSRNYKSYMQRVVKQEIKQEPGIGSHGVNDYYCDVCKLILNSETTYNTHMAGKKHKKALRQLSEQDVAKSSVLELTEPQKTFRSTEMNRIELRNEVSKIQETCENAQLLIVGLDFVQEIRKTGNEDTRYFCQLCNAQCVANSIIPHIIGFKHQKNCLKEYCYESYRFIRDIEKRDSRVEKAINKNLGEVIRFCGRGRIRVFQEIKGNQKSPESFDPHKPSTSRQALLPRDVQSKKVDEVKVTDEECLSRDFSDFYCKICDTHMNNVSMWESHARGKKHSKNKKKAEEGLATNNYIEAPPGTISHLEELIEDECNPNDIIVGLKFIRENQGENGDLFNCYLCGSVCPTCDIVDHLYLKKHKTKYLEKMLSDGYPNAINEISCLPIGESGRESLIDDECLKFMAEFGRGRPIICIAKKTF